MSSSQTVAPYGAWVSPIDAAMVAGAGVRLGGPQAAGGSIYWTEGRPADGGRVVVVRRAADGSIEDLIAAPFNVRTRVHEYGGGAYLATAEALFFSDFADGVVYRQEGRGAPLALTAADGRRYADFAHDATRRRLICVCEDHRAAGEPVNTIVAIDASVPGEPLMLAAGHDFYAAPRLSPDGAQLAFLSWDHPDMPWDSAALWLADVAEDGALGVPSQVAGGPGDSVCCPGWSPDGLLTFAAERSGFWNLYRLRDGAVVALLPAKAEFGLPHWTFGGRSFAYANEHRLLAVASSGGSDQLVDLDLRSGTWGHVSLIYASIQQPLIADGAFWFVGGAPLDSSAIVRIDLNATDASGEQIIRRGDELAIDRSYLAYPLSVEFPTEGGLTAFANVYTPTNRDFCGPDRAAPPLLVMIHGGPTGVASVAKSLEVQFWTSRGYCVADVNYGGSTGFGRAYRERLDGQWGVVDVDDCCNLARYLVARGEVDGRRLFITGGSAGGYTVLCALAFRDVFRAGTSYYGISDAEALAADTHKFESRYTFKLIAPYPNGRAMYLARSPIHFADRVRAPILFLQGLDDEVVPPNQSEAMHRALLASGVRTEYHAFAGEGHGFRRAETIIAALEAEERFYASIAG